MDGLVKKRRKQVGFLLTDDHWHSICRPNQEDVCHMKPRHAPVVHPNYHVAINGIWSKASETTGKSMLALIIPDEPHSGQVARGSLAQGQVNKALLGNKLTHRGPIITNSHRFRRLIKDEKATRKVLHVDWRQGFKRSMKNSHAATVDRQDLKVNSRLRAEVTAEGST